MVISSPSFADIVIEPEGILAAFGGFKYVQFHANLEIQPCRSPIYKCVSKSYIKLVYIVKCYLKLVEIKIVSKFVLLFLSY